MPFANINSKSVFYTFTPSSSRSTSPSPLTLVFIHGLGSSSSFYSPILPYLSALGYHCLTFDTHGSGSSPYTGSGNSIASIASDVRALLNWLNVTENVVLVGHSMGGIVASYLAASVEKQQEFKAVILIGPVNPSPGAAGIFEKRIAVVENGEMIPRFPNPMLLGLVHSQLQDRKVDFSVQIEGMEPLATSIPFAATSNKSSPLVHAFIRALLLGNSTKGYISLCKAIAEAPVPQYRNIKVPLLIIGGADDMTARLDGSYILEEYGSENKELRVLEGVGHWHVIEAYLQVQDMIDEFLRNAFEKV